MNTKKYVGCPIDIRDKHGKGLVTLRILEDNSVHEFMGRIRKSNTVLLRKNPSRFYISPVLGLKLPLGNNNQLIQAKTIWIKIQKVRILNMAANLFKFRHLEGG